MGVLLASALASSVANLASQMFGQWFIDQVTNFWEIDPRSEPDFLVQDFLVNFIDGALEKIQIVIFIWSNQTRQDFLIKCMLTLQFIITTNSFSFFTKYYQGGYSE